MSLYLLTDIGSTYTKVCQVDVSQQKILATAAAPTTISTNVTIGLDNALNKIGISRTTTDIPMLVCSSAAGGLKIVAVGLTPDLTLQAATMAALGAGGKVLQSFSYRLTNDDIATIRTLSPDIILLSGGIDGGDQNYILHNAEKINSLLPDIPLIIAGNRDAYDQLRTLFSDRDHIYFTKNVMPSFKELDLLPTKQLIREVFLKHIIIAKGLDQLQARATILMPTPVAVLKAATLLSQGIPDTENGLGDLLIVDIGGATTDVYSCTEGLPQNPGVRLRGLQEPWDMRTVEADVGMRYTLPYLLELVSIKALSAEAGCTVKEFIQWSQAVHNTPDLLPKSLTEELCETACAKAACQIAVDRHAGKIEQTWTADGQLLIQEGKDLAKVQWIIGSGGPLVKSTHAKKILSSAIRDTESHNLKPLTASFLLDQHYILWAMGLLAEYEPVAALRIMKQNLQAI